MKRFQKILTLLTSAILLFSSAACNISKPVAILTDYDTAQGEFEFYGYHSMNDGKYIVNGEVFNVGEDFRTEERIKEYFDCGLNLFFLQNVSYDGEDYQTSELKKYMDMAQRAGAEKIIIYDTRLYELSRKEIPIVGEGYEFESQEALNAYVADCLKDYTQHEAFYGLILKDEPWYTMFDASEAVYRAIKAYDSDIFIKQNLFPMSVGWKDKGVYCASAGTKTLVEIYEDYLTDWQSRTGAPYVMFDDYPMVDNGILSTHLQGLKIAADYCKEKSLDLYVVAQTTAMLSNGKLALRQCEKDDMYWQLNMLMGFGVKHISYFTYWRRAGGNNTISGEFMVDGSAFISSNGEKTRLYYTMTQIHKEMQAFAPVITQFDYTATAYYMQPPMDFAIGFLGGVPNETLQSVRKVTVKQGDVALVNELYDSERGNYMYMVQNIQDPIKGKLGDTSLDVNIEFDQKYEYVAVYYKGEVRYEKLINHTYSTVLSAGYAEFLIPYNK